MPSSRPVALITGGKPGSAGKWPACCAPTTTSSSPPGRETGLRALAARLRTATCHVIPVRPRRPDRAAGALRRDRRGRTDVDVLVNNAGFGDLGPFADADLAKMLQHDPGERRAR